MSPFLEPVVHREIVSEITYYVSSGTLNSNSTTLIQGNSAEALNWNSISFANNIPL